MVDTRLILSGLWIALMFTYLLGDVLRIYAGDYTAGKMGNQEMTPIMFIAAAVLMLIPIVMLVLCLTVAYPAIRWITIVAAGFLFLFNLISLPSYPGAYDKLLIAAGLVFNGITIWYAWQWVV